MPKFPSPTLSVTRIVIGMASLLIYSLLLVMNSIPAFPHIVGGCYTGVKPLQNNSELESAQEWEFLNWHPLLLWEQLQEGGILNIMTSSKESKVIR